MKKYLFNIIARLILLVFSINTAVSAPVYGQSAVTANSLFLPPIGQMVRLSPSYSPEIIKGIKIFPNNPLRFDFMVDSGDTRLKGELLKEESKKLIKYFLSALTVPDEDFWVNLSPYEKDRIIPHSFGQTEMGRDLLAQDYMLKQLTASLIYPEDELGKEFWEKVYKKAEEEYGTTEIPVNTFNKVWIMPQKAVVYENENTAFIVESRLKVMLEEDYLAMKKNDIENRRDVLPYARSNKPDDIKQGNRQYAPTNNNNFQTQILRELIIPAIEKEVNEGSNFTQLRQIYHSMILAAWFKQNLKQSILSEIYVNQNKIAGVDIEDKNAKQKIYKQYVEAFKKGVYNYIREDYDLNTQEVIPRKYFSGGISTYMVGKVLERTTDNSRASKVVKEMASSALNIEMVLNQVSNKKFSFDANTSSPLKPQNISRLRQFDKKIIELKKGFVGYQVNIKSNYDRIWPEALKVFLNNIGAPFQNNDKTRFTLSTKKLERDVLQFFADIYGFADNEWGGYMTSGGTEGNMYGIHIGRELYPTGVLYFSKDSHYSIIKIAETLDMDYEWVESLPDGEIDYSKLEEAIARHPGRPAIMSLNIQTTMKGAIDDLAKVREILDRKGVEDRYIHLDMALSGMLLPFMDKKPMTVNFENADSFSISGHKFIGSPFPSGVVLTKKENFEMMGKEGSESIGVLDDTLLSSRSGHAPLLLWYAIQTRGYEGFREEVRQSIEKAEYLYNKLREIGWPVELHKFSNTVVFARPSDELRDKWQLAPQGNFVHVFTMQHVSKAKIDAIVEDLKKEVSVHKNDKALWKHENWEYPFNPDADYKNIAKKYPQRSVDEVVEEVKGFLEKVDAKSEMSLGFAGNLNADFSPLLKELKVSMNTSLNNVGDPWGKKSFMKLNSHDFEREVVQYFADLYKMPKEELWGYVTAGGTEGNMYGMRMGRTLYPDGVFLSTKGASHFSIEKMNRILRMEYKRNLQKQWFLESFGKKNGEEIWSRLVKNQWIVLNDHSAEAKLSREHLLNRNISSEKKHKDLEMVLGDDLKKFASDVYGLLQKYRNGDHQWVKADAETGEMDYEDLDRKVKEIRKKDKTRPLILNLNIGTAMTGAIDNLDKVLAVLKSNGLKRSEYYIHADAALSGVMLPFMKEQPFEINFEKIDSIALSGHKFLGVPFPTGIILTKNSYVDQIKRSVEYVGIDDTTIFGSRNAHAALFLWYAIQTRDLEKEVKASVAKASYFKQKLDEMGWRAEHNKYSNVIVFDRPSEKIMKKFSLAPEGKHARVVTMQHVTRRMMDELLEEMKIEQVLDKRNQRKGATASSGIEQVNELLYLVPNLNSLKEKWQIDESEKEKIINWIQTVDSEVLPESYLFKKLFHNILMYYTRGYKDYAVQWVDIFAEKWGIKSKNIQSVITWIVRHQVDIKKVSDNVLSDFFRTYVESYQRYSTLRDNFIYYLPLNIDNEMKLKLPLLNMQRMLEMFSPSFINQDTVLKASIEGTDYFIGLKFGLAESTFGLYLEVGEETKGVDPLKGAFMRIGLDTQEDTLRINMMQGVSDKTQVINDIFPSQLGFHPAIALLYVALDLANQGHIRVGDKFFTGKKVSFENLLGIRPEYIETMKNGIPTLDLMINYERFGLRKSTEYGRWQKVDHMVQNLLPLRLKKKDFKSKGIQKMRDSFEGLKEYAFKSESLDSTSSSSLKGGVDFDPKNLNIEIQGDGSYYSEPVNPQLLKSLIANPLEGFSPIIFNITPITNIPAFLGLNDNEEVPSKPHQNAYLNVRTSS